MSAMASQIKQRLDCLLYPFVELRVTGLCEENPLVTGGFPSQSANNAEIFSFDDVTINPEI